MNANSTTLWSQNSPYTNDYESLFDRLPTRGEMPKGTPIEAFRVVNALYYDLYNNGLGNIDVLKEDAVDVIGWLNRSQVLPQKEGVQESVGELLSYLKEVDEYDTLEPEIDDDGEEVEPDFPDSGHLDQPLETLMEAVIDLNQSVQDPCRVLRNRPVYSGEPKSDFLSPD